MLRSVVFGLAALGEGFLMRKRLSAVAAATALALLGNGGAAQAVTIDFDNFAFNDNLIHDVAPISTAFSLDGFTFTPSQFTKFDVLGTQEGRFPGKVALFDNANFGTTTLTRSGGGTFSLLSIDVANILSPGTDSITFHGHAHGGAVVDESFTFNSFRHLTTLTLDNDFRDLDSVSFDENPSPGFQFINLVVSMEVPEPGLALLGIGLAGLVRFRSRHERAYLPVLLREGEGLLP